MLHLILIPLLLHCFQWKLEALSVALTVLSWLGSMNDLPVKSVKFVHVLMALLSTCNASVGVKRRFKHFINRTLQCIK